MAVKKSARETIASRCALEFRDGDCVNLGIGIPDYSANFIPDGVDVLVNCENGLLGMGPDPDENEEDPDLLNASKGPVTYVAGSSVFSSSDSFGLIRGYHLDLTIIGALQVSGAGDLANWCVPGKMMKGIGGAMDLCSGVRRIIIATTHCTRDGKPKIVRECTLPLTGKGVADMIITELAVFKVRKGESLLLVEHHAGVSVEEIRSKTAADFEVSLDLAEMRFSPMNRKHASVKAGAKAAAPAAPLPAPAQVRRRAGEQKLMPALPAEVPLPGRFDGAVVDEELDCGTEDGLSLQSLRRK